MTFSYLSNIEVVKEISEGSGVENTQTRTVRAKISIPIIGPYTHANYRFCRGRLTRSRQGLVHCAVRR
jgi:hypothetical protein